MIRCKSREHVELELRTRHLTPYLNASLAFSRYTSWLLPRFLHMAPLRLVIWRFNRHAVYL